MTLPSQETEMSSTMTAISTSPSISTMISSTSSGQETTKTELPTTTLENINKKTEPTASTSVTTLPITSQPTSITTNPSQESTTTEMSSTTTTTTTNLPATRTSTSILSTSVLMPTSTSFGKCLSLNSLPFFHIYTCDSFCNNFVKFSFSTFHTCVDLLFLSHM